MPFFFTFKIKLTYFMKYVKGKVDYTKEKNFKEIKKSSPYFSLYSI